MQLLIALSEQMSTTRSSPSLRCLSNYVQHIEFLMVDGAEPLSNAAIQDVVHFNIYQKSLLEQLTHLLSSNHMTLGCIFSMISNYVGMYTTLIEDSELRCAVSGDKCTQGRYVVLCEKLSTCSPVPSSYSFFVRTDIFKYIRFFYFIQHFNFFVTRLLVNTTHADRYQEDFLIDLHRKYLCATTHLMFLIVPLEII